MRMDNRYWFRAKRSGLGWGLPCSWQGWAFFLLWLAGLSMAAVKLMPAQPFAFAVLLAVMTLILVAACYMKGDPAGRSRA
jgi:hypothetical protein